MNRQTRQDTLAVGHVGGRVAVRDRAKIRARTERTESKVRWLLRGVGLVGVGGHGACDGVWCLAGGRADGLSTLKKHDSNQSPPSFDS